ncbi:hypothetical protein [Actinomadura macra]|uniref:hypothetical protein n=1 Tax=Actinomadura macra TaxID=46164 RepID=UPI001470E215|nr:hypothetical protein [Actinomadura macra]
MISIVCGVVAGTVALSTTDFKDYTAYLVLAAAACSMASLVFRADTRRESAKKRLEAFSGLEGDALKVLSRFPEPVSEPQKLQSEIEKLLRQYREAMTLH